MKAFEVSLNGLPLCVAGIGPDGVLNVHVGWNGYPLNNVDEFLFHIGGLDSVAGEHVRWAVPDINVGDEVLIRLVDAEHTGAPSERYAAKDGNEGATDDAGVAGVDAPSTPPSETA